MKSKPSKQRNIGQAIVYATMAVGCTALGVWVPALADTAGEVGAHVASQGENVGKAISVLFYALGMGAGGGAFMKLKANRDNPQQNPLSHAAVLGAVCAGLLFLPETFQSSGDTIYNKGAVKNEVSGTTAIGQ
ncbi:MAG: hypothetical protein GY952_05320 [Rhodobacteraceae bacterium]|nr:hypothetical protein [Paracoccaceae bacterium]